MKKIDVLNPRDFLNAELNVRMKANPQYSLRSFARTLQMSPASLSMILSGRRGLSLKMARNVTLRLGLEPHFAKAFINGAQRMHSLNLEEDENYSYEKISLETFEVISDWYHLAILSLIDTKGFQPSIRFIASRLGISNFEAKAAVDRLVRLGILDTTSKKWKQIGLPIKVENTVSTSATKKFHHQLLDKAKYSLDNDPMEIRDMSETTLAIDPKLMPQAIEKIRKFRRELTAFLESQGNAQEVYHLAVQFYPVSRKKLGDQS